MKKLIILFLVITVLAALTGCTGNAPTKTVDVSQSSELSSLLDENTTTSLSDSSSTSSSEIESSEATTEPTTSASEKAAGTTSKTNNQGQNGTTTSKAPDTPKNDPPATSQPTTQTPVTSTPSTETPTSKPTDPPKPEYEVMGQDFLNGVLSGINSRRSELGLPLAHLNSALSTECLVQAKKMADAGNSFHSSNPSGCEGVARVPYNHPADLLGDVMCTHVPDFLYDSTVKIGVAVVKKGNYLYAVVQGLS